MLLTAGGNTSGGGWSVIEIDADSLETGRIGGMGSDASLQGASSAASRQYIWVGTYGGDRIGYFEGKLVDLNHDEITLIASPFIKNQRINMSTFLEQMIRIRSMGAIFLMELLK